jgi:hypothetical protein
VRYVVLALAAAAILVFGRTALLHNRASRARRQSLRAAAAPSLTTTQRVARLIAWPVFFVLVGVVVAAGLLVGWLVGPH